MNHKTCIKNVSLVNEGKITVTDVLIENEWISALGHFPDFEGKIIDGTGKYLFPGIIDGQVHFRDPGLTHKADLYTESKAAISGGVTSFIDMPNTIPNVLNMAILEEKYRIASEKSLANYGFLLGVNADNIDEVIQTDTSQLLAVTDDGLYFTKKGNLLADNVEVITKLFKNCKSIIAIHAEKEQLIEENEAIFRLKYGEEVPIASHPYIRSEKACLEATKQLIQLANEYDARIHILHLTTAAETDLFRNDIPLEEKKITTEVCVQNLWFSEEDYQRLGVLIKWNPAIKTKHDRDGLLKALLDDRIDIITTDHAPHLMEEKLQPYFKSMSGAPMVQHALSVMLDFYHRGLISLEKIAEKMAHNVAKLYHIDRRGYVRPGYFADLILVDLEKEYVVGADNIRYKCGWSPLEGTAFKGVVTHTFVNGNLVLENGSIDEAYRGMALKREPEG